MNKVFLFFVFILIGHQSFGQSACPSVTVNPTNASICSGCTTLTANVQGSVATTSYSVASIPYTPYSYNAGTNVLNNIDDTWTAVINLPFCFQFYGNTYSQCLIGSNAIISFDLANANAYNTWPITAAIPDNGLNGPDIKNCIMGPWHDIDPSVAGNIYYNTYGTAPCRAFVVSWDQVALFSCNNLIATSQIVLYETTNIIDIYIQDKPTCAAWNAGAAIEGIEDATGTQALAVPGRNFPANWTATNDGQRFTPTGAPQYSLQWFEPPNNPIGTATTVTVCPTASTTYTAVVTNTTCSTPVVVSATAVVTIGAGAPPTMTTTPTSCGGNTGSATATPNGGQAPFTYLWSTAPPQNTQTATGLAAGNYTVIITDATGCSGTSTVAVTSTSGLNATTSSTQTSCTSNNGTATATPNGGTAPYTYSWSTAPAQSTQTAIGLGTGTYSVTITDANGCSTTVTASVTAPNGITSVNMTTTQPNCNGGSDGTASAAATGGTAPYTFLWSNSQATQTATGLSAGSYSVTVTDAAGCTFPAIVSVTNPPAVTAVTSFSPDTCDKKIGTAIVNVSGGAGPYTYQWLTNPSQATQTAFSLLAGTYTCIITDSKGCTVFTTASVGNIAGPTANFTASPPVVDILAPTISFFDLSSGNPSNWIWNFGDGLGTSTQQNPNYIYQNEGTYIVTLVVTNSSGCPDTIQQFVVVEGFTTIYVPNTFTPNSDGFNEYFMPLSSGIDSATFSWMIFDRWGNEIFKTNKLGEAWDGTVRKDGNVVQEDVYVYVITYYDTKNNEHRLIGNVNVVK